ncbi:hypothetical protein [Streptomyces sp. cg35]|uniref:hypothetical protein n=1 Tax=Streptomyces sp. cg35 TaxID=3421650 RepID=UPI003D17A95A
MNPSPVRNTLIHVEIKATPEGGETRCIADAWLQVPASSSEGLPRAFAREVAAELRSLADDLEGDR